MFYDLFHSDVDSRVAILSDFFSLQQPIANIPIENKFTTSSLSKGSWSHDFCWSHDTYYIVKCCKHCGGESIHI